MANCPNCYQTIMLGAIFCHECGSSLITSDMMTTQNIQTGGMSGVDMPTDALKNQEASSTTNVRLSLHLLDVGTVIPLAERDEYTFGRSSDGQPIVPDIDLTPYKAYEMGVSRLHAVIKKQNRSFIVMDLSSSNGTYLNGLRLAPDYEQTLHHGDILSLGKLKIQVLFP